MAEVLILAWRFETELAAHSFRLGIGGLFLLTMLMHALDLVSKPLQMLYSLLDVLICLVFESLSCVYLDWFKFRMLQFLVSSRLRLPIFHHIDGGTGALARHACMVQVVLYVAMLGQHHLVIRNARAILDVKSRHHSLIFVTVDVLVFRLLLFLDCHVKQVFIQVLCSLPLVVPFFDDLRA